MYEDYGYEFAESLDDEIRIEMAAEGRFEDEYEDDYDYEDDGQPDEYTEWQDYMGGDDSPYDYDCGFDA